MPKHQARTKKNKSGQKLLCHGEQKFWQAKYFARRSNGEPNGEQVQRVGKTGQKLLRHGEHKSFLAKYFARRSNGKPNGEQFQKVGKTGQEHFAMASKNSARRTKAVSSDQSDVAETHWQRKLISPWRAKFRQAKCHFFSICIKAHFSHFILNNQNISHFRKTANRGNI